MNLLMITRKIDKDDWLAGHSYEWAKALSAKLKAKNGKLKVICLEKGNTEGLDAEVYSLGKELGRSRMNRRLRFQRLASKIVKQIDGVFSHQNPEYAIWVWPWTFLYRKKLISWYTHKSVTWKTRLMLAMSDGVLTASKKSFRISSPKVKVLGHGIDTDKFTHPFSPLLQGGDRGGVFKIVSVGRISPSKDLETLILAVSKLVNEKGVKDIQLHIYGDVGLKSQKSYLESLKSLTEKNNITNFVSFKGPISHTKLPEIYQNVQVCVNLSHTGSMDKVVLEAMACQCPVITSNEAFFELLHEYKKYCLTQPNEPKMLAEKILQIVNLKKIDKKNLSVDLRNLVVKGHSLKSLAEKIISEF